MCKLRIDKMKRIFYLAVSLSMTLCALWMSACRGDHPQEEFATASDDRVAWDLILGDTATRAVIDADGSGRFVEGDTVVVCARNLTDDTRQCFTLHLSNGRWEPEIRWREIGQQVQFTAWHLPSAALPLHQAGQSSSDYLHALAQNQQGDGYRRSDLLRAETRAQAGERVQLRFGHALSRLHVVLESRDGSCSATELQQAEVQVQTPVRLAFRLTDGTLTAASDPQWITPARTDDHTHTALVCPQPAGAMPADGWIRVRIADRETTVAIPDMLQGKPFEGLEAGRELTYRLNLQRKETADPFAGATRWVYGVKEPSDDQWKFGHTQLPWTPGCGWYDCNKIDPSDTRPGGDGLMCWAAATSNLIHWWLAQNRATAAMADYRGPAAEPSDMLHSAVFQLYKSHFSNRGDNPLKAINWFFNGVFHKNMYEMDPVDPSAGFFREQLGTRSLGAEYVGQEMKRDRFNAIIKRALDSRQGILFVVNMGRNWTTHAVTLWGAKFNDEGLVETLYMVDNNDGRSDPVGTMRTMEVRYQPYSATNSELYPYVPNSVGDFIIRIESLCTLSLGSEWIH